MVKYMSMLNAYTDFSVGRIPPLAQLLYFRLFLINNKAGWCEWFGASNRRLLLETGIGSEHTIINCRNILRQYGLIDYKVGKRGQPTMYCLKCPVSSAGNKKSTAPNTVNSAVISAVNSAVNSAVKNRPNEPVDKCHEATAGAALAAPLPAENGTFPTNNEKDNDYDKDSITRAREAETRLRVAAFFAEFWAAYPRKVGKGAAERIFMRLKPDAELFERMMDALFIVRASEQWQKDGGRFIPNPATWLNQRRWEDEPPPAYQGTNCTPFDIVQRAIDLIEKG